MRWDAGTLERWLATCARDAEQYSLHGALLGRSDVGAKRLS